MRTVYAILYQICGTLYITLIIWLKIDLSMPGFSTNSLK